MLNHLKRSGISRTDLVKVYNCICALLDLSLNILVRYGILICQYTYPMTLKWFRRVLKSIFPCNCYNDILNYTGISSLKEQRDYLCRKYFNDTKVNSHKLNHLLPDR